MVLDYNIKTAIIKAAKKFRLKEIILFGSRARGDCFERSDIDLAASFGSPKIYFDFCDEIEEIDTLLMFDIVDLSSDAIDLDLRKSIRDEGVLDRMFPA